MKIDVSEIIKVPGAAMEFEVEGDLGPQDSAEPFDIAGPFVVRGVATSTGDGIYVDAHAKGAVRMTCSRCLSPFTTDMNLKCEAKFAEDAGSRAEGDEDEVEIFPLENGVADLSEMIRQEIVLNLPMKPLCASSCKGIRPQCGANLNEADCGCEKSGSEETAFGKKLLEALNERGKKHGRS